MLEMFSKCEKGVACIAELFFHIFLADGFDWVSVGVVNLVRLYDTVLSPF